MIRKLIALSALCSLAFACGKDADKPAPAAPPAAGAVAAEGAGPSVAVAPAAAQAAPPLALGPIVMTNLLVDELTGFSFDGKAEKAIGWKDASGDNTVVFSAKGGEGKVGNNASLYVNHFAKGADGKVVTLRTVKEHVPDCEFDLTAAFEHKALGVTDLDSDKVGEVTFAYAHGCRSDVSPDDFKLLMLEGGDKYIIRGARRLKMGGESFGGESKIDESLTKGPKAFLEHATSVWETVVDQTM